MKIAVLCPNYPTETSGQFAFVHTRLKLYHEAGHTIKVFLRSNQVEDYQLEKIFVHRTKISDIKNKIRSFNPDVISIYYPLYWMIPIIKNLEYPKVAWILGHELLWSFRLTAANGRIDWLKKRLVLIPRLAYQIYVVGRFINSLEYCIFISNWLLETVKKHALVTLKKAQVIPNPVDTTIFSYKTPQYINRGISVRSLERSVYGLDIAIKAFADLPSTRLTILGKGRFYQKFKKMINAINSNCELRNEYIEHNDLSELYNQFGFFVAPSRAETQGLAMCEAMACGLPVAATNVGGIPEFVRDGIDGFLAPPNNPLALQNAVKKLLSDKKRYYQMSSNARKHIVEICDSKVIIGKELEVMARASVQTRLTQERRKN